ncbi:NUDIX hydrolase [Gellertiella hungarica]|uniref:8-oxo-dGTP pyrophosphatase MutT (NUDIX family) n=1 Tax=Gellertiella hungarica TaxID=1572859 RepID=A0A7W6NKD2_9HYPH|nr:NUDIX hydrolase [Gellertiella hungarica]MBB4064270.1 8-oxo-dGTP pyrophosphatase MutT (NUDIX family) [Gellertiella hungarica]
MALISRLAAWLKLMFRRPPRQQYAALCYRQDPADRHVEVLLVTSRDTGRWIIPKGWPMADKPGHGVAAQEAFEEAGVTGQVEKRPIGYYLYDKVLKDDFAVGCRVQVHALAVDKLLDDYPEKDQRKHRWFPYKSAAEQVREPTLRSLILDFGRSLEQRAA